MARYTIHLPVDRGDPRRRLEGARLVRDGFSAWAAIFGPFWLFRHGAWIAGALTLVLVIAVAVALALSGLPREIGTAAQVAGALLFGLEGSTLRRWNLRLSGYEETGLVAGTDRDEIERRMVERELSATPEPVAAARPAIGFFAPAPRSAGP